MILLVSRTVFVEYWTLSVASTVPSVLDDNMTVDLSLQLLVGIRMASAAIALDLRLGPDSLSHWTLKS